MLPEAFYLLAFLIAVFVSSRVLWPYLMIDFNILSFYLAEPVSVFVVALLVFPRCFPKSPEALYFINFMFP